MKKLGVLVAAAVLMAGCHVSLSSSHTYVVKFADGLDVAMEQGIVSPTHAATDSWERETLGTVHFTYDTTDTVDPVILVRGEPSAQIASETNGGCANDWADGWGSASSTIRVATDFDTHDIIRLMLHELGHAIGLHHTGPGTLMFAYMYGDSEVITCADVQQFCGRWGCDSTEMPICEHKADAPLKHDPFKFSTSGNGGACGQIVDAEPAPYGHACCTDATHVLTTYFDGTTDSVTCSDGETCVQGVCGGTCWGLGTCGK